MTKRFATPVDICDDIMPTWVKWDLLTAAPSEQCKTLNHKGASKYRISDGKNVMDVWVILDLEGSYRRAPMELEHELDHLYCTHQAPRRQTVVAYPTRTDGRITAASPVLAQLQ